VLDADEKIKINFKNERKWADDIGKNRNMISPRSRKKKIKKYKMNGEAVIKDTNKRRTSWKISKWAGKMGRK
jgi:hypothetical protein